MKISYAIHKLLTILILGGLIMFASCKTDPEVGPGEDTGDNKQDPTDSTSGPAGQIDPDKISEYLVLQDASKITGSLPTAPEGQWKIDARDTIFVIKGLPIGDRIQIMEPENQSGERTSEVNFGGMYVQVVGSQFYFDTPGGAVATFWVDEYGDHHTTYTFNLDLDLEKSTEEIEYPFSAEIIIQPHDDSGAPLDEFERTITVEDPENSCNDIRRGDNMEKHAPWWWEFSIRIDATGFVEEFSAPGWRYDLGDTDGGCCFDPIGDVTNWNCSEQSTSYVKMPIDPYYEPLWAMLNLWDDGRVHVAGRDVEHNYNQSESSICTLTPAYLDNDSTDYGDGTHNFSLGASNLTIEMPNFSSFAKPLQNSNIVYTCHSLLMYQDTGEGSSLGIMYKYLDTLDADPTSPNNPFAFADVWFD